jgi:hypothetical protein
MALNTEDTDAPYGRFLAPLPRAEPQPGTSENSVTFTVSMLATDRQKMSSQPKEFHLRLLPEPCMTLSSHTAPDVQPLP